MLNIIGLCVLIVLFILAESLRPYYGAIEITRLERGQVFNMEKLHESFPDLAGDPNRDLGRFVTANLFRLLRVVFAAAITTLILSSWFLIRQVRDTQPKAPSNALAKESGNA